MTPKAGGARLSQCRRRSGGGKYGGARYRARAKLSPIRQARSAAVLALLLVLDVFDDLGHVLLLLFITVGGDALLAVGGLGIGYLDVLRGDRLDLLLGNGGDTRAARLQKR